MEDYFFGFIKIDNHTVISGPLNNVGKLNRNIDISFFRNKQVIVIRILKQNVNFGNRVRRDVGLIFSCDCYCCYFFVIRECLTRHKANW